MCNPASSLVLGTAQLGSSYGIANRTGQPSIETAKAIIATAWENGIREFDTAQGYGNSEEIVGTILKERGLTGESRVITKFDPSLDHLDRSVISDAVNRSLSKLGVSHLFGIMLHREEMLSLLGKGLSKILSDLVKSGRAQFAGVSVYSPDKALHALEEDCIDMIQLPSNILDRRFERAGVFERARKKGKKIYIRSVFLQGLLLMDYDKIPAWMSGAKPVIQQLDALSAETGMTRQELALGYIKTEMPDARVVFGADMPEQVKKNAVCWQTLLSQPVVRRIKQVFNDVDVTILNPALWPQS